jgi:hypothetical protein
MAIVSIPTAVATSERPVKSRRINRARLPAALALLPTALIVLVVYK